MVHDINKIAQFLPFLYRDAVLDVFIQSWQFRRCGESNCAEYILISLEVCWKGTFGQGGFHFLSSLHPRAGGGVRLPPFIGDHPCAPPPQVDSNDATPRGSAHKSKGDKCMYVVRCCVFVFCVHPVAVLNAVFVSV